MTKTFKKSIPVVDGFSALFSFNRVYIADTVEFLVTVIDKNGKLCSFTMQKTQSDWKIVEETTPEWIIALEKDLSEVIRQYSLR